MRMTLIAAALVCAAPAAAQDLSEAEASILPRLIDSLCIDLVEGRTGCETAVLLTSETEPDSADLVIFTDRRAHGEMSILEVVRNISFNGPMFGQTPWLEQAENGSLLLQSEQIGIGRSPWNQTLTIAFRDGAFVVAGLTYSTYDRIAAGGANCDVNFLTGDWEIFAERPNPETEETIYEANETGQMAPARPLLAEWNWTAPLPEPCSTALAEWWASEPQ